MESANQLIPLVFAKEGGIRIKDALPLLKGLVLAELSTKYLPQALAAVGRFLNHIRPRRRASYSDATDQSRDGPCNKTASIILHRNYIDQQDSQNDTFDALIWRMCQLPQTRYLKLAANNIYVISNTETIAIDDDLSLKQLRIDFDENNNVQSASVEVFSHTIDLLALKDVLANICHQYRRHLNNQLGQQLFYFDNVPTVLPKTIEGDINFDVAQRHLTFTMSKMQTNKSLDNIYGESMQKVRKRVQFFLHNKQWYAARGLQYTLGILMSGPPGVGKTATIKGISKDARRHIFNIKLSESTTVSQINNLFFSERVNVIADGQNIQFNIPIDQRIIVMEDVDCLTSIVLERKTSKQRLNNSNNNTEEINNFFSSSTFHQEHIKNNNNNGVFADWGDNFSPVAFDTTPRFPNASQTSQRGEVAKQQHFKSSSPIPTNQKDHPEKLTLSHLLNVLDGVLETPGRILIMTSNYPERLDSALTRPGRIDLKVAFTKTSHCDILEMIQKVAGYSCKLEDVQDVTEFHHTPAEVIQKIFENIESLPDILASLRVTRDSTTT